MSAADGSPVVPVLRAAGIVAASLTPIGPKRAPLSGTPVESELVLYADERVEYGIWEVTPGAWRSRADGHSEVMHVVSGAGRMESDDGTVTALEPGAVVVVPDGWSGVWRVTETLRKSFAITRADRPGADVACD